MKCNWLNYSFSISGSFSTNKCKWLNYSFSIYMWNLHLQKHYLQFAENSYNKIQWFLYSHGIIWFAIFLFAKGKAFRQFIQKDLKVLVHYFCSFLFFKKLKHTENCTIRSNCSSICTEYYFLLFFSSSSFFFFHKAKVYRWFIQSDLMVFLFARNMIFCRFFPFSQTKASTNFIKSDLMVPLYARNINVLLFFFFIKLKKTKNKNKKTN